MSTMPSPSRVVVRCPKPKTETACANSTSTSASVRTLAAVASAKARNQNSEARAPRKPARSEGRYSRMMAAIAPGVRSQRLTDDSIACSVSPITTLKDAAMT